MLISEMVFKKLHLGSVSFSKESLDDVKAFLESAYTEASSMGHTDHGRGIDAPPPPPSLCSSNPSD